MRKLLLAVMAVLVLGSASAARAEGFNIGVRAAYVFPAGEIGSIELLGEPIDFGDLGDAVDGGVPLWLEANYQLTPNVSLGAYFQYAFLMLPDDAGGADGNNMRVGGQVIYGFAPAGNFAPWIGAGIGWEWLEFDDLGVDGNSNAQLTFDGLDFMLQGGAEFAVAKSFRVGPFASVSFGRYGEAEFDAGGGASVTTDFDEGWHEWLQIGVRGTFGF
jgi:outer membrane protein W